MKLLTIICASALILGGCAENPFIETEIVFVDKPIPFIPPPPTVPVIQYEVDKLTSADITNPGIVGQAYVHDMTFLRKRVEIDDLILNQYRIGSADFEEVEKRIGEIYNGIGTQTAPAPKMDIPAVDLN